MSGPFWALGIARAQGAGGEGIFLEICLCLFSFIILTSWTNLNSMTFWKTILKNNSLTVKIFFNLQNYPIFRSEERLVNLVKGRECFAGQSIIMAKTRFNLLSSLSKVLSFWWEARRHCRYHRLSPLRIFIHKLVFLDAKLN